MCIRDRPPYIHVNAVPVLGPGLGGASAHDLAEPLVLRELPPHRHDRVRHTAAVQRVRGEPGPQHDAVGERVAGGHPETEHALGQRGFGGVGGGGQQLGGGGGAEHRGGGGQEAAAVG